MKCITFSFYCTTGPDSEKGLIFQQLPQILPGHGTGKALLFPYLYVPITLYQVEIIANLNRAPSMYTNVAGCFLFLIRVILPTTDIIIGPILQGQTPRLRKASY